jgi:predicted lipoprotein with Yx(FWY)xxD motif
MHSKRTLAVAIAGATAMSGTLAISVGVAAAHPSTNQRAPSVASSSGGTTVSARHKDLGTFLVSKGRTLYMFEKDTRNKSHCGSSCATEWPPLITNGAPQATHGVKAGLLGTTMRSSGKEQVTYNGHPLYFYSDDSKKGQTHGEGVKAFGAEWYVVNKKGNKIDDDEGGDS